MRIKSMQSLIRLAIVFMAFLVLYWITHPGRPIECDYIISGQEISELLKYKTFDCAMYSILIEAEGYIEGGEYY
jgi:hypothetical protein